MNITQKIKPIHPFAARMAPEIALKALHGLSPDSVILDPMAGSGTVLRTICESGYRGKGFDIDPLSVMLSKAWTTKVSGQKFLESKRRLLQRASSLREEDILLPWIDEDKMTQEFIRFWFAPEQIADLRKLSYLVNRKGTPYADLFKIALSKLIITKSRGASLAADVPHSRPHKVRTMNDFDVLPEFGKTCTRLLTTLCSEKLTGNVTVKQGDARKLTSVKSNSIDLIITSPPYLNALDYMRGHKLSLVWLGYRINELTMIRGNSVGAEKAPDLSANLLLAKEITKTMNIQGLPGNKRNMIYRYALDMNAVLKQSARVLKSGSCATFVIGNSTICGVYIENTHIAEEAAKRHGLTLVDRKERTIPQNKRYLPPPGLTSNAGFDLRMRTETILTFRK